MGDLSVDAGLDTALIISLFTDRRANADDILPDQNSDLRGWWGDSYADNEGDLIGSRLWELARERDLSSVYLRAKDYIQEALQWLIDDGVVDQFDVAVSRLRKGVLLYVITIVKPGAPARQYQFTQFWSGN